MSSSLRSRQLVSGFTIIVVGILILGILLHFSMYERKKDDSGRKLQQTALDILGFLEFDHGIFKISDNLAQEASYYIGGERLDNSGERERFAYIYDLKTNRLVWTTHDRNHMNDNTKLLLAFFDFDTIKDDPELLNARNKSIVRILRPVNVQNTSLDITDPKSALAGDASVLDSEYQVALQ
ncbi:MAG: hypothetical protein RLZZ422_2570, partial [Pseudomonadota bacterium]